jgi:hypothetical protein
MTYARLLVADPGRWRAAATAWRALAQWTGRRAEELVPLTARMRAAWFGAASAAATVRLDTLRRGLQTARLGWWEADQALSEFAAGLSRAKALLDAAVALAGRNGLTVDADGGVHAPIGPPGVHPPVGVPGGDGVRETATATAIGVALTLAARADARAAGRLADIVTATADPVGPPSGGSVLPPCGASPADVRRWWDALTPAERRWLVTAESATIGALDGVPATYRDMANRLRLDEQRAEVDRALAAADGGERRRLRELRTGLGFLADRLDDGDGPRAYLLRLDLAGEGRAVVALGDPDSADNVLTHVPGMTADLASLHGELIRAERVAVRAQQLAPQESTSAVLWLDYDAPDFVHEAASPGQAVAGAQGLQRFQDGLRVTHDGPAAHRTVLGHSYGSLVVGVAAAQPGLAADSVVFVGSPGVGVDAAAQLQAPAGQVWSTTSRTDVIQYAAVSPGSLLADVVRAAAVPVAGPVMAFGLPEDDLYFGRNPSDAAFGARVFASQTDAGHLGYWDPGRPALDNLARITLGGSHQSQVTRP